MTLTTIDAMTTWLFQETNNVPALSVKRRQHRRRWIVSQSVVASRSGISTASLWVANGEWGVPIIFDDIDLFVVIFNMQKPRVCRSLIRLNDFNLFF